MTVAELGDRMSSAEFIEWLAFDVLEAEQHERRIEEARNG